MWYTWLDWIVVSLVDLLKDLVRLFHDRIGEGKSLDLDLGFAAYVSYLHMEVTHTNPIMLGKCLSRIRFQYSSS